MYHNSLLFLPFISTEREREEEGQASSACLNTWLRNRWSNKMPKAVVVAPGNKGPGNKEGRCVEIHFYPLFRNCNTACGQTSIYVCTFRVDECGQTEALVGRRSSKRTFLRATENRRAPRRKRARGKNPSTHINERREGPGRGLWWGIL